MSEVSGDLFPTFRAMWNVVRVMIRAVVNRKVAKRAIAVAVTMLLIHAILMVVWGRQLEDRRNQMRRRGEPVTVADLAPKAVPDSKNAAFVYRKAFRLAGKPNDSALRPIIVYLSSQDRLADWAKLGPAIRKQVHDAAPLYPLIRQAISYPKCVFPVKWSDGPAALFPHLSELRQLDELQIAKAIVEAKDGDMRAAVDDLRIALRVSEATQNEPSLIAQLVRFAAIGRCFAAMNDISNTHPLTSEQAYTMYGELSAISLKSDFIRAMRSERAMSAWMFDAVRKDWETVRILTGPDYEPPGRISRILHGATNPIRGYLWRPLSYKDEMICLDLWDEQLRLLSLPYPEFARRKTDLDPESIAPRYAIGTRAFFPVFARLPEMRYRAEARLTIAGAAMALQACKDRFGFYPPSLGELKTRIGWPLPDDPFTGRPLVYKRVGAGFRLYSLGPNMKDDGGRSSETIPFPRRPDEDDIVWTCER